MTLLESDLLRELEVQKSFAVVGVWVGPGRVFACLLA